MYNTKENTVHFQKPFEIDSFLWTLGMMLQKDDGKTR